MKKRMKKLVALALTACMFASITACGSNEQPTKEETVKEETVSVVSEVNTESISGIENDDSEADKETEVMTEEENNAEEVAATDVDENESKESKTEEVKAGPKTDEEFVFEMRETNTRGLNASQIEEFDREVMNFLKNGYFSGSISPELIDLMGPVAGYAYDKKISAERYAEIIK